MNSVLQTTDYEMFKVRSWNRAINKANLKKLDASVKKEGWLKHPIMVNEKMEVADGQHRLAYAKEHNLPVYYVVIPGLSVNDCVVMNNARTAWSLADYVSFYAEQGNQSYITFRKLMEKYPFVAPSVLANIIKNTGSSGGTTATIKSGTFEIDTAQYNLAVQKLDYLKECARYLLSVPGRAAAMFAAVAFAYDCPGVRKERLMKQIKNYIGIVTPPANLEMALQEVENLYNYRNARGEYVYIYTEYKKYTADRVAKGKVEHND